MSDAKTAVNSVKKSLNTLPKTIPRMYRKDVKAYVDAANAASAAVAASADTPDTIRKRARVTTSQSELTTAQTKLDTANKAVQLATKNLDEKTGNLIGAKAQLAESVKQQSQSLDTAKSKLTEVTRAAQRSARRSRARRKALRRTSWTPSPRAIPTLRKRSTRSTSRSSTVVETRRLRWARYWESWDCRRAPPRRPGRSDFDNEAGPLRARRAAMRDAAQVMEACGEALAVRLADVGKAELEATFRTAIPRDVLVIARRGVPQTPRAPATPGAPGAASIEFMAFTAVALASAYFIAQDILLRPVRRQRARWPGPCCRGRRQVRRRRRRDGALHGHHQVDAGLDAARRGRRHVRRPGRRLRRTGKAGTAEGAGQTGSREPASAAPGDRRLPERAGARLRAMDREPLGDQEPEAVGRNRQARRADADRSLHRAADGRQSEGARARRAGRALQRRIRAPGRHARPGRGEGGAFARSPPSWSCSRNTSSASRKAMPGAPP